MKVGVIGAGAVGAACVFALVMRAAAREIVLIDRVRARAKAVAADMRYGTPLGSRVDLADGDYPELAGAAVVMITAGVNEKTGGATDRSDPAGRLRLLDTNAGIYRDIVPRIIAAAPGAVILVITDPPDPLADLARALAGHGRILSTGTYLDSLRLRVHLGQALGVDAASVEAQVLGEHGTSEVFIWSGVRIAGVPLADVLAQRGLALEQWRARLEREVRYANIAIIEGNNASQYGIGMVSARIAEMVLRDEQAAIPIGCYSERYGVTLSLPAILGREGVKEILPHHLSPEEEAALQQSADTLRRAVERVR
ncbi:MAG: lactate/malate family dehydrogenase [Stellaceae bacterium]